MPKIYFCALMSVKLFLVLKLTASESNQLSSLPTWIVLTGFTYPFWKKKKFDINFPLYNREKVLKERICADN